MSSKSSDTGWGAAAGARSPTSKVWVAAKSGRAGSAAGGSSNICVDSKSARASAGAAGAGVGARSGKWNTCVASKSTRAAAAGAGTSTGADGGVSGAARSSGSSNSAAGAGSAAGSGGRSGAASATAGAAASATTGGGATAAPGQGRGTRVSSSRIASAALRKVWADHGVAAPVAMSSTQRENCSIASAASESRSALAGFCSASQVLASCSMAHAASPNSLSPTMRELPLSVWKARRSVVPSPMSPGLARRACKAAVPFCTTSRASSRKISRISASSSSSGGGAAGAGAGAAAAMTAGAGAGAGAATGAAGSSAGVAAGGVGAGSATGSGAAGATTSCAALSRPITGRSSPRSSSYTKSFFASARW